MIRIDGQPLYFPVPLGNSQSSAAVKGVTADAFGLRLAAANASCPLGLNALDGSLGRLTLPRGFAIDPQLRCYFANRVTGDIWIFDSSLPQSADYPFRRLLNFSDPPITHPSGLWSLAANSESLFVIRPDQPALYTVASDSWAIEEIHCFPDPERAIDVATWLQAVYILTDRAVYIRQAPALPWELYFVLPARHDREYARLLISKSGEVFLHVRPQVKPSAHSAEGGTRFEEGLYSVADLETLPVPQHRDVDRTQFHVPPVISYPVGQGNDGFQYLVPAALTSPCQRQLPEINRAVPPELASADISLELLSSDDLSHGFLVREDGGRVRRADFLPATQRLFLTGQKITGRAGECEWIAPPVDSRRYHCRWDRVELQIYIPAGCRVVVSTQTLDADLPLASPAFDSGTFTAQLLAADHSAEVSDALDEYLAASPETSWSAGATFNANSPGPHTAIWEDVDFLVRSQPGRFLCVRVQLFGDGFSTPLVRRIMARGPRQSHVDFLPAVMKENDASRDFLERFVSVFQTEWDRLETTVDQLDNLFNPTTVATSQLNYLATSLGITLPAEWTSEKWRDLLQFAPHLLLTPGDETRNRIGGSRRGTVAHIRSAARAILGAATGLTDTDMNGFPWVIEGFRERPQMQVGASNPTSKQITGDTLAPPAARTLHGPDSSGRLQLGDNSVLGERRLLPITRQELDVYTNSAHRIRVVVPSAWVRTREDLCVLETALDAEKPAHVACEITLVRAGMRIELQSTLGVDTILGDWPPAVLGQPASTFGLGQGLTLPGVPAQRPPPLALDGPLATHTI